MKSSPENRTVKTDPVKCKICGLTRPVDIRTVNLLKPEYIGFVFFERSSRYVSPAQAARLKKDLDPAILAVGVFLDHSMEFVEKLLKDNTIDIIQLHGEAMGEDFIARLRNITNKPIIRAFSVSSEEDLAMAEESTADYILLDSGKGGTGRTFDWNLLHTFCRPYFLAGGLTPENAAQARSLHPYAMDISSGVETDGVKDPEKIRRFLEAVRFTD